MITFYEIEDNMWLHGELLSAGVFGVTKKLTSLLRLIVDRRRRNACEASFYQTLRRLGAIWELPDELMADIVHMSTLPHASQLCEFMMRSDEHFSIWMDDVSDYYYRWEWPKAMLKDNLLGEPLDTRRLLDRGARDRGGLLESLSAEPVVAALRCPAMGDQKAATLSQVGHAAIALRHCEQRDWMAYGFQVPPGSIWKGGYIDDAATIGALGPGDSVEPVRASALQTRESFKEAGFEMKREKSLEDKRGAVVWGGELSTKRLDVGAEVPKMMALICLTVAVLVICRGAGCMSAPLEGAPLC